MKKNDDKNPEIARIGAELFEHLFIAVSEINIDDAHENALVKVVFSRDKRFYEGHTLTSDQAKQILLSPSSAEPTIDTDGLRKLSVSELVSLRGKKRFYYCIEPRSGILKRRILTLYAAEPGKRLIATVSEAEPQSGGDLVLRLNKSEYVIRRSDIIYVDYGNHSVVVHDRTGKRSFFSVAFSDIASELLEDRNFVRSYKNCIVNMDKITKVEKDAFIMENGDIIAIPQRRLRDIKAYYEAYLVLKNNLQ